MKPRTLLGVASLIAFAIILELYESPPAMITIYFKNLVFHVPSIGSFLVITLLFTIATVIARGDFLKAAIAFSFVIWVVIQVLLYRIALPLGTESFLEIALANAPGLFAYVLAAVIGAYAGAWYYAHELKPPDTVT